MFTRRDPLDLSLDPEWLVGYRSGDRRAFQRIVEVYAPVLDGVIRAHAFSGRDRAELLQECFSRIFALETRRRYQTTSRFAAFITGLAQHVVADDNRARRRAQSSTVSFEAFESEEEETLIVQGRPQEEEVLLRERTEVIRDFLTTLDTLETRIVALRFEGGLSQRDVAAELSLGRQRIRTLDVRIRLRMASFFHARGLDQPKTTPRAKTDSRRKNE